MNKDIKYYKSIEDISVYVFYKIIHTKNINFLIENYEQLSTNPNFKVDALLKEKLNESFSEIIEKYNSLTSTNKTIKSIKSQANIDIMVSIYDLAMFCLKNYENTKNIEFLFVLNDLEYRFIFDSSKNIEKQINSNLKVLKALKMKIKIAKIKHSKLYISNSDENKKIDYLKDLEKQAINIERFLDLNYQIKTKEISLHRWCILNELVKEKKEQDGKI